MLKFNSEKKNELFVSINNTLFLYKCDLDGAHLLRHHTFNANVASMAQDKDTLFLGCDNDSLLIYDLPAGKVIDEWTDFVP